MKMLNTYPPAKKQKLARVKINEWAKWPFLLAIYILPIVNVMTGLPAWSVVALWSLWIVWTMLFSPQLVEYNRISNVVKLITNVAILLVLIDLLLSPGWAIEVVALVGFGGLVILSIYFSLSSKTTAKSFSHWYFYFCHNCFINYRINHMAEQCALVNYRACNNGWRFFTNNGNCFTQRFD